MFIVVVGGAMAGAVLLPRLKRSLGTDTLTFTPTAAPTSQEQQNKAIVAFLAGFANGGKAFEEGSPHQMAARWVTEEDPMQIKRDKKKLKQRPS